MSDVIIVRLDLEVEVKLPEGVVERDGEPSLRCEKRAVEAALCALPQNVEIFLDGENEKPAKVFIDASETFNVEEVRVEPE